MDLKDPRNVGYKQLRNAKFFLEMIGLECPYDRNGVGIVYALQHDLTITDTVIQHMIIIMKKYHSFVSLCLPFVIKLDLQSSNFTLIELQPAWRTAKKRRHLY